MHQCKWAKVQKKGGSAVTSAEAQKGKAAKVPTGKRAAGRKSRDPKKMKSAQVHDGLKEGQKCEVDKCRSPEVQQGMNATNAKVQKYKSARSGKVHKGKRTRLRKFRGARMPKC